MRVYKLVRVIDGRFYSPIALGDWRLEYRIGEIIRPKIGKLFVFADLESAKNYPVWFERDIFVCEAENAVKATTIASPEWQETWEKFWNEELLGGYLATSDTYVCDSLKVLEIV